jgi:hypothetical protein
MRIFKNHYSAVFVFILTGLFFVPLIETDDVMAKDKYLEEKDKYLEERECQDYCLRVGLHRDVCNDQCANLGPSGFHPLTKDEQKTQSKMCFHDCTRKGLVPEACDAQCELVPITGYHRPTPTIEECLKREKNIWGDGCPDRGDPKQYKGNCGVFDMGPTSQLEISQCRNNQFHSKHNYEPDE